MEELGMEMTTLEKAVFEYGLNLRYSGLPSDLIKEEYESVNLFALWILKNKPQKANDVFSINEEDFREFEGFVKTLNLEKEKEESTLKAVLRFLKFRWYLPIEVLRKK